MTPDRALVLARQAHDGQTDVFGRPFLDHVLGVAALLGDEPDEHLLVIALLHDVVEKGSATYDELRAAGATEDVIAAVDGISQRVGERSDAYLARCARNPSAYAVKRIDLLEKLSPALLAGLSDRASAALQTQVHRRLALLDEAVA